MCKLSKYIVKKNISIRASVLIKVCVYTRKGLSAFNKLWNRVFLCVLIVSTISSIIPTVQFYNKSHRILGQSSQMNFIFLA